MSVAFLCREILASVKKKKQHVLSRKKYMLFVEEMHHFNLLQHIKAAGAFIFFQPDKHPFAY